MQQKMQSLLGCDWKRTLHWLLALFVIAGAGWEVALVQAAPLTGAERASRQTADPDAPAAPAWMEPRGVSVVDLAGIVPDDLLADSMVVYSPGVALAYYVSGERNGDTVTVRVRFVSKNNRGAACLGMPGHFDTWPTVMPAGTLRILAGATDVTRNTAVATAFYDDVLFGPANAGSARIHGWNGSGWTATQTLLSPAPFNGERFGLDSAIRGNWIIVGAGAKDPACEADPNCDTGSAFVYRFDGGSWVFDQKLLPTGGSSLDSFGVRVDIDGNRAIVGAGDDTNANGSGAGAAYVYGFNPLLGGNWFQSAKLLAPVGMAGDRFGADVGVSGVWAIVGSDSADGPGETNAGRADMFRNGSGGWTHEATLVPDALIASSRMGRAVAIDGSVAVIGAPGNSNAPGAAYVYELVDGLNWTLIATLTAHDGANGDSFGSAVAVRGDQILVGASGDDGARGGAYLFWRVHGGWVQRAKLTAADGVASDVFSRVAIDNGRGLVGAYLDDTGSLTDVGSVYVFKGLGDCNGNVVVDACDIAAGMPDTDADGIPDMCEP